MKQYVCVHMSNSCCAYCSTEYKLLMMTINNVFKGARQQLVWLRLSPFSVTQFDIVHWSSWLYGMFFCFFICLPSERQSAFEQAFHQGHKADGSVECRLCLPISYFDFPVLCSSLNNLVPWITQSIEFNSGCLVEKGPLLKQCMKKSMDSAYPVIQLNYILKDTTWSLHNAPVRWKPHVSPILNFS